MPPRLTLREIQARRQRTEEGVARFESLNMQFAQEVMARAAQGRAGMAGIADALEGDASWQRRQEGIRQEMAAAIEMIREGMPKTTIDVVE